MSRRGHRGRIGLAGFLAAAFAIAAVPEPAAPTAARSAAGLRPRPAAAPAPMALQIDMVRLRRLQPAKAEAAPPAVPGADAPAEDAAATAEDKPAAAEVPEPTPTAAPAPPEIINAFATKSWYVPPPPPPPVKPPPPPKPTAPPLPFTYMGRIDDPDSVPVLLLVKGDRLYTVSEGDSIDGTYRVDRIDRGQAELIYLPLQQKQVLPTPEPG